MQYNGSIEVNQRAGWRGAHYWRSCIADSWELSNAGTMVLSAQQVADAPPGLIYSCKITATTGQAVLGTNATTGLSSTGLKVYLLRAASIRYGERTQPLTIGFWAKSSRTGVFTGCVRTATTIRSYPWTYTIGNANTWEWKVVTVLPDTVTALDTGMVPSLHVLFTPAVGATRAGPPGAWSSNNPTYLPARPVA